MGMKSLVRARRSELIRLRQDEIGLQDDAEE